MRTVGRAIVILALVLAVAVVGVFMTVASREDQSILGECGGPEAEIATSTCEALTRALGFLPLLLMIVVVVALLGAAIYLVVKQ